MDYCGFLPVRDNSPFYKKKYDLNKTNDQNL